MLLDVKISGPNTTHAQSFRKSQLRDMSGVFMLSCDSRAETSKTLLLVTQNYAENAITPYTRYGNAYHSLT